MTLEQAASLAELEQEHRVMHRVPDEEYPADEILLLEPEDTRLYRCASCRQFITVRPDGEVALWTPDG